MIVTSKNKTILIDGGEGKTNTVVPYLLDRKIKHIDYIIISHFDSDHCNGLVPVIEKLNVKNIIISKQAEMSEEFKNIIEIANKRKIPIRVVTSGDRISADDTTHIDILYPEGTLKYDDLNNNSIVAKLNYGKFSMLFTGDIEKEAEQHLINLYKETNILNSTVLKVPHHGSKSSSTELFLDTVKPRISLIGVGASNTFRTPEFWSIGTIRKYTVAKFIKQI